MILVLLPHIAIYILLCGIGLKEWQQHSCCKPHSLTPSPLLGHKLITVFAAVTVTVECVTHISVLASFCVMYSLGLYCDVIFVWDIL